MAHGEYPSSDILSNYVNGLFLVAEEGNEVVGYIAGEELRGNVAMIWFFTTNPRGIGTKLLAEFEKLCRKNAIKYILLYAPTFNEKTLVFYRTTGYNEGLKMTEFNKILPD
ncbi:MAG: GNAT family N-acetyltransferase [Candidatus Aenigmarchaeota archaeon]|nr:GNAT family N-acetyltransferase [Candidatus Aenigmarchaeota archaeon]